MSTARTAPRKAKTIRHDTKRIEAQQLRRTIQASEFHRQHGPIRILMRAGQILDPPEVVEPEPLVWIRGPQGERIRVPIA